MIDFVIASYIQQTDVTVSPTLVFQHVVIWCYILNIHPVVQFIQQNPVFEKQ